LQTGAGSVIPFWVKKSSVMSTVAAGDVLVAMKVDEIEAGVGEVRGGVSVA
jgi:hypothetical protein